MFVVIFVVNSEEPRAGIVQVYKEWLERDADRGVHCAIFGFLDKSDNKDRAKLPMVWIYFGEISCG